MDIPTILPEIIVGIVLGGFAWAFKGWSAAIERASEKILERLDRLTSTFQEHRLLVEKRVTKVETEIEALKRRFDLCDYSKLKKSEKESSD
jgi:glutathionyl-hydroquinone reductase